MLGDRGVQPLEALLEDLLQQHRLVLEMAVQGARGDPDLLGDQRHRHVGEAARDKEVTCRAEDLVLAVTRTAALGRFVVGGRPP
ncbi:hypothetical protein LUX39_17875 [Actinomadura madurae]|nr:hypothetical protein [Actinomadura madurae]MCQ0015373.1 hypothetical protein [Actinomadura madurae]